MNLKSIQEAFSHPVTPEIIEEARQIAIQADVEAKRMIEALDKQLQKPKDQ